MVLLQNKISKVLILFFVSIFSCAAKKSCPSGDNDHRFVKYGAAKTSITQKKRYFALTDNSLVWCKKNLANKKEMIAQLNFENIERVDIYSTNMGWGSDGRTEGVEWLYLKLKKEERGRKQLIIRSCSMQEVYDRRGDYWETVSKECRGMLNILKDFSDQLKTKLKEYEKRSKIKIHIFEKKV